MLACLAGFTACEDTPKADFAAADLTRQGFMRDEALARRLDGHTIRVSGFVDHANLYGDRGTREIPGDWWSGEDSNPATWRFNLKAHPNEKAGYSFAVHVRNDADRDELLSAIVADARAGRATEAYVTGTLRTFDAPTNVVKKTGIYLEVNGSSGVRLGRRTLTRQSHAEMPSSVSG
jgi:hypothetical protein